MANELEFLEQTVPGPEEETAPVVEIIDEAATEPAPEPKPEPKPAPEPGHVPISAMLDEREKRQALERQLAELKAKAEPPAPLDATQQLQAALYAQNLRTSRRFAEARYGAEAVARAHDWASARCDADPFFNAQIRASDHPYEDAMQAWSREQIVAEVTPQRLEAFRAWEASVAKASEAQGGHQPSPPSPGEMGSPPPASPAPPRSLVTASGTGSLGKEALPIGEGRAFEALFKG